MQVRVNKDHFPFLFKTFFMLEQDNGGINRIEDAPKEFVIDGYSLVTLLSAEAGIAGLTEDELENFVCGEEEERDNLLKRKPWLQVVDDLLTNLFNNEIERVNE
jgi:hypothetical protein